MKENEVPEKIWVHELSAKELNVPLKEYHIEYIRADAFIEKACAWIGNNYCAYDSNSHYDKELFIEEFRKYMEE